MERLRERGSQSVGSALLIMMCLHAVASSVRILPTGFVSTCEALLILSLVFLALIHAKAIFFAPRLVDSARRFPWVLGSVLWFMWISLPGMMTVDSVDGLRQWAVAVFEYRFLILMPLLIVALDALDIDLDRYAFVLFWSLAAGVVFSLLNSVFPESTSIVVVRGSYIINGSLSSACILLGFYMVLLKNGPSFMRVSGGALCVLAALSVLIDEGKTGYIQVTVLLALCLAFALSWRARVGGLIITVLLVGGAYWSGALDSGIARMNTVVESGAAVVGDTKLHPPDCISTESTATRLCYYYYGVKASIESPWVGHGITSVSHELNSILALPNGRQTDNIHNEILNQFLIGGVVGLVFTLGFFGSLIFSGLRGPSGIALLSLGIAALMLVAMLFNSSIKDFGEKNLFLTLFVFLYIQQRKLGEGFQEKSQ